MKKIFLFLAAFSVILPFQAQTLNVTTSDGVTYKFPAARTGDMVYNQGTSLTIMGKTFAVGDIASMSIDNSNVKDNEVSVSYNNKSASVTVAGNVARYVTPSINGAHVSIEQTNTEAVDDDELTYVLSGTTDDGDFSLSGSYKCTISLAGLTMTNQSGAAINVANGKRIQISAKRDTENTLSDCSGGSQKACIYSKGQIQLQGNGVLNVVGKTKHAIKSGDYISVKNLTLNITSAVGDGVNCEEYLLVKSGTVNICGVGDDGIQCDLGGSVASPAVDDDHTDEDTGNIYLEGGTLSVTADSLAAKCVKNVGDAFVSGGTFTLNANGGVDTSDATDLSYASGFKSDGNFTYSGGDITINVNGAAGRGIGSEGVFTSAEGNTGKITIVNNGALVSSGSSYFATAKGIKAGEVVVDGGNIDITMEGAAAKGIKADKSDGSGNITITGGVLTVNTSGTGAYDGTEADAKGSSCLKADNNMTVSGGTQTLESTGSGGKCIKVDGILNISGNPVLTAKTTGATFSSNNKKAQPKAIKSDGNMTITGGSINATSKGHEAIETKGVMTISGGEVFAFSPADDAINSASHMYLQGGDITGVSNANDGIDSNGNLYISGGVIMACGAGTPECGLDAAERYCLYITGGTVLGVGGGNNTVTSTTGSQCVLSTSGSPAANTIVSVVNGSTKMANFTIPSVYSPNTGGFGGGSFPGAGKRPGGGSMSGGSNNTSNFSYVISCPGLISGNNYTVTIGSASTTAKASTSYSGR